MRVLCRFRPLNAAELAGPSLGRMCIAQLSDESVQLATSDRAQHSYTFDRVFGTNAQQRQLFEDGARPIVQAVLQGYNGAVIAYGQTGSGKTHTMMGPPGGAGADADEAEQGLCARCVRDLFAHMQAADAEVQFELIVSFVEIYQERIRDLLDVSKDDLKLGEHGANGASVYVKDVTGLAVDSEEQVLDTMRSGAANRAVAATGMNAGSSRSHSVFTLMLKQKDTRTQTVLSGKLMLVDLAGSEQVSKAGVSGQQLEELKRINRSLSALGNVINALTDDKSTHVPYRDSKLTRLLQDSLGGNTKTVMIANCGPADYNYDETLTTLRYADRAKQIKNKPRINEDPKDAMLREFQEEIARLRARLAEEEARARKTTTVIIDGKEVVVPASGAGTVERIVERTRLVGVSDEEVAALQEKATKERAELMARAEEERRQLLLAAAKTDEERRRIESQLSEQQVAHDRAIAEKSSLENQLQAMQEKLLIGGQVMDKAARQEEELRKAQVELEERRRQEATLARELEEANVMIEEQYASMAEELEAKTRKLKKVWNKYQAAQQEIRDLSEEFQKEREDVSCLASALTGLRHSTPCGCGGLTLTSCAAPRPSIPTRRCSTRSASSTSSSSSSSCCSTRSCPCRTSSGSSRAPCGTRPLTSPSGPSCASSWRAIACACGARPRC